MACTRHNNYQNPNGTQPITNRAILRRASQNCRRNKSFYPSFAPVIYNLSVLSSSAGAYSLVNIDGANFLPASYGTTYVNFGQYTDLPITFYSSFNISFVVPLNAPPGNYAVTVVNIYNGNFSPSINQTYPGNLVYAWFHITIPIWLLIWKHLPLNHRPLYYWAIVYLKMTHMCLTAKV